MREPRDSTPLAHNAFDRLLEALTALDIAPGDRINVDTLARVWDMSQTPIREALARLAAEGLVEKHHNRGYRATDQLTTNELYKLFAVRRVLEPAGARWAAENAQTHDVEQLQKLMLEMEAQAECGSYGDFAVQDAKFHATVARASGNSVLRSGIDRLHVHLHLFRVRRDAEVADAAVDEHRRILSAIAQDDPILAKAAMASHIDRSWARLKKVL